MSESETRKRLRTAEKEAKSTPPAPFKKPGSHPHKNAAAASGKGHPQNRPRTTNKRDNPSGESQAPAGKKSRHEPVASPPQRVDHQPPSSSAGGGGGKLFHPFRANFNDHFETSLEALKDVLPAIQELRQLTRPSAPEAFTLYDPYYCSGTIVEHWGSLGFDKVLHENRDFYQDIKEGTVPGPYDMLVTNPPFSEDHMLRMMRFLTEGQERPWAFLAPDYIAAKPWYRELIRTHFTPAPPSGKGKLTASGRAAPPQRVTGPIAFELPPFLRAAQEAAREKEQHANQGEGAADKTDADAQAKEDPANEANATGAPSTADELPSSSTPASSTKPRVVGVEPFYIIPKGRYDFKHPTGAGKDHSHFKSIWYVWPGRRLPEVMRATTVALLARPSQPSQGHGGGGGVSSAPAVVHGLQALDEGKFVTATERRPNPQRRQQKFGQKRW